MTQIAEPGTTWDEAPPAGRISHWINAESWPARRVARARSTTPPWVRSPSTSTSHRSRRSGAAVAAAKAAFPAWRATSLSKRTEIMFRVRNMVEQHRKELAALLTAEHGKVPSGRAG